MSSNPAAESQEQSYLAKVDWHATSLNVRMLRKSHGLSTRAVAIKAGIAKNTVMRVEQGKPIQFRSLDRLCAALKTTVQGVTLQRPFPDMPSRICRAQDTAWDVPREIQRSATAFDPTPYHDPVIRYKLGVTGTMSHFDGMINNRLEAGKLMANCLEIYSVSKPNSHGGEEYLYCLKGTARVTVGSHSFELNQGDSVSFWPRYPHSYAPGDNVRKEDLPVLLLCVHIAGA